MANEMSYVEAAYDVLKEEYEKNGNKSVPMKFTDLMLQSFAKLGLTDEEKLLALAGKFYTALTLDGRFVMKENNTWVLREHEMFENVHIDMNEVYIDEDGSEEGDGDGDSGEKKNLDSDLDGGAEEDGKSDEAQTEESSADEDEDENN